MPDILLFLLGLAVLLGGAHALVRGAASLAQRLGLSPLMVGMTVVAYGTSAPELAINLNSVLSGAPDVGVGNVVGANISNLLLILGVTALISPIMVKRRLIRLDVPLMIGVGLLFLLLAHDGMLSRSDGAVLALGLLAYTVFAVMMSRKESAGGEGDAGNLGRAAALGLLGAGLGMLVLGSGWLVDAAVSMARAMGVSELVIGLTVVSLGTTMPELITSIVASLKGQRDMALGNVIGSFLCNLLGILGISALVSGAGIPVPPAVVHFDAPFMVAAALACLPIFFIGGRITRLEGAVFLAYYVVYALYLILDARAHDALPAFSAILFGFAVPLTAVTLALFAYQEWRGMKGGHEVP